LKPVLFGERASDELSAAAQWYEAESEGLGVAFTNAVSEAVARIAQAPTTFPRWQGDPRFRRVLTQRFPYVVFYRDTPHAVVVVAIAHGHRQPGYWLTR
jgi:plasmid stabilization system protein ParE